MRLTENDIICINANPYKKLSAWLEKILKTKAVTKAIVYDESAVVFDSLLLYNANVTTDDKQVYNQIILVAYDSKSISHDLSTILDESKKYSIRVESDNHWATFSIADYGETFNLLHKYLCNHMVDDECDIIGFKHRQIYVYEDDAFKRYVEVTVKKS